MEVVGNYAYIGEGASLTILDVSTAGTPVVTGRSGLLPDIVLDLAIDGGYAHLTDGDAGLRVLDVSNPSDPGEVAYYALPVYLEAVAVSGDYAYLTDFFGGLWVADVSNPPIRSRSHT